MGFSKDRREFLRYAGVVGLSAASCSSPNRSRLIDFAARSATPISPISPSPVSKVEGKFSATSFLGDNPERAHARFWNTEAFIQERGGRPKTAIETDVLVAGGGMSGLLSAYLLKDRKPLVFEHAANFGGNSRGEEFNETPFSLAAAYISLLEKDSAIEKLLKELHVLSEAKNDSDGDSHVLLKGKGVVEFWSGQTDPKAKRLFREVRGKLRKVYDSAYPTIPPASSEGLSLKEFYRLDRQSALDWMKKNFAPIHPHILEYYELYAWSSFGGSLSEISAAQFLNFVSSDANGVTVFPGGNSRISRALYGNLQKSLPPNSLRANTSVLEVRNTDGKVEVLIEAGNGVLELYRANHVVFAAPKFVAKAVVKDVSTEQLAAWAQLKYRSYVVANVLLKNKVTPKGFDLYCLNQKAVRPSLAELSERPFVDICFADWVSQGKSKNSILTLYRPYAFDGARPVLFDPASFATIEAEISKSLPDLLKNLGFADNSVEGIRLSRFGHALPLASTGFFADGTSRKVSASHGRIHFAHQDNFANPCFETCFNTAQAAASAAKKK